MNPSGASDPCKGLRSSLGILAWNEAGSIGRTIESLFRQTLFTAPAGRLSVDPTLRHAVGERSKAKQVASTSQMG